MKLKSLGSDPRVKKALQQAQLAYTRLTLRERGIIWLCVVVIIGLGAYSAGGGIYGAFTEQLAERERVERDYRSVLVLVERYSKLDKRRLEIEARYQKFEVKEGVLSYLERLVKEKGNVQAGRFKITSGKEREFGGNYVQSPFRIKLDTTNLNELVAFLKELTDGSQPLILTELDIQKNLVSNQLSVELDVSSMRQSEGTAGTATAS